MDTAPMSWPVGAGRDFAACSISRPTSVPLAGVDGRRSRRCAQRLMRGATTAGSARCSMLARSEELRLAREGLPKFDLEAFREGHLTPVFFGSALRPSACSICSRRLAATRRRRARRRRRRAKIDARPSRR